MAKNVSSANSGQQTAHPTIQLVSQGNGGVGKGPVASWLAEFLINRGQAVRCMDGDPVNRSMGQYRAFALKRAICSIRMACCSERVMTSSWSASSTSQPYTWWTAAPRRFALLDVPGGVGRSRVAAPGWPNGLHPHPDQRRRNAPGEQSTLEFSDIDLVHGFLTIRRKPHFQFHPKNYQLRRVPIADPARMAIEKMAELTHSESDLVFHRVDGSRWGDIAGSFDSLVDRAGLQRKAPDNLTMHSLRHTFPSWCSLGGLSLRRLQAFLGHKSITTTERYSHLGNSGVHPAYTRLSSFLNDFLPTGIPTEPAEAEKREREGLDVVEKMWWRRADSNRGPRDYESLASLKRRLIYV